MNQGFLEHFIRNHAFQQLWIFLFHITNGTYDNLIVLFLFVSSVLFRKLKYETSFTLHLYTMIDMLSEILINIRKIYRDIWLLHKMKFDHVVILLLTRHVGTVKSPSFHLLLASYCFNPILARLRADLKHRSLKNFKF